MAVITNIDAWDKREFNDAMHYNPEMQRIERLGSARAYNYAEFMLDTFGSLYKHTPEARDPESASPDDRWMDEVYKEISQLQEWRTLREHTKMNPEAAAIAATKFCEQFFDAIPRNNSEEDAVPDLKEIDMSKVRRVAREACKTAIEETDEFVNAISSFGYSPDGSGRPQYASPTAKREVAARLLANEKLRQIADLAGRMRRIAAEKQHIKTKHGVDELADITIGDDLSRLIPYELSKLAHPVLKADFRKKYLEKQLIQYKLRGREKQGKGPIIFCVDESGSMQGNKDIWCKSVFLAILQIAQQQKRSCSIVHFDSSVTRIDTFPTNKVEISTIMDSVSHFTGGGTDFIKPLNEVIKLIKSSKNFNNADVILITDGDASIDESWLKKFLADKKTEKFSIISVLIGTATSTLNQISDKIVLLNDLQNNDQALTTMFTI